MKKFAKKANELGELIERKNESYGNSFAESEKILKILYPNGVSPEQYTDMLAMARVIDKLFRVSTMKDAFGESPWQDIAGYAILMSVYDEEIAESNKQLTLNLEKEDET